MIVGVGAGIIPWPSSFAKYFKRDYTPKSVGLNAPLEIRTASIEIQQAYWEKHPDEFKKYWNGELSRKGNNPLVYLNIEVKGLNGGFNCMSFPNPGINAILDEILIDKSGVPIRLSLFGQNISEIKRLIEIAQEYEYDPNQKLYPLRTTEPAYSQIKSIEINVSCPNTRCGESCSTNDLNQIMDYISTARQTINKGPEQKELIIKFSPSVENIIDYILPAIEAGADAFNFSNTIPGYAVNGYTGEVLMEVGGVNGDPAYKRMLKTVSDTYQKMKELDEFRPIYASGGITNKEQAEEAIRVGATYIDLGYAFKDVDEKGIGKLVNKIEAHLAGLNLETIRGTKIVKNNPSFWDKPGLWRVNPNGGRQLKVTSYDHKPLTISKITPVSEDSHLIRFVERFGKHTIGQYLGLMTKINHRFEERPFTIYDNSSVIIQDLREHNKSKAKKDPYYGIVSHTLTHLKPGDQIYVRGPLGNGVISDLSKTLAIGGGCGAAAIAKLNCDTILSFTKECEVMLEDQLKERLIMKHVDEVDGGFLPVSEINFSEYDNIVLCGPKGMMFAAAKEATNQGINPNNIYLIMESIFKCFNNLCGACDCGGIRLCKTGPAVKYSQLLGLEEFIVRDHSGKITERVELK